MVRWFVLAALSGCSFNPLSTAVGDANPGGDGGLIDGHIVEIDGMIEDAPAVTCSDFNPRANPRHVEPCDALPGGAWVIGTAFGLYDTDNGNYVNGDDPQSYDIAGVRVVSVSAFEIEGNAALRVMGSRPLVILSWTTIEINGTLNASSERNGNFVVLGAGANPGSAACVTAGNGENSSDSGGGGGGAFGADGGEGGDGKGGDTDNEGGAGGDAVPEPTTVRGGCPGGNGGTGQSRGLGGPGGGAVQLISKGALTINGRIHAGGAAGDGGHGDGGGGGGGSGGYIGIDAPNVSLGGNSILAANGGGGGTGCDAMTGPDGENARLSVSAANGGPESSCIKPEGGGDGGARSTQPAGEDGQPSPGDSAGGGGGAAGFILVWTGTLSNAGEASPTLIQK
jgi:hypothetical protein